MSKAKKVAVAAGAGAGGLIGSGIGIAGAFGAISGALPLALLGAYLGHRLHKLVSSTQAASDFKTGLSEGFNKKSAELKKLRK